MTVLHVVTAGGLQPVRALALDRSHGGVGDVVHLTSPAVWARHSPILDALDHLAVLDVEKWPDLIGSGGWSAVVVEKYPWGAPNHEPFAVAFLGALSTVERRVLVRRIADPAFEPRIDVWLEPARFYTAVVDGEGTWVAGSGPAGLAWAAGTTRRPLVGTTADRERHGPDVELFEDWYLDGAELPNVATTWWNGCPVELRVAGIELVVNVETAEHQARAAASGGVVLGTPRPGWPATWGQPVDSLAALIGELRA